MKTSPFRWSAQLLLLTLLLAPGGCTNSDAGLPAADLTSPDRGRPDLTVDLPATPDRAADSNTAPDKPSAPAKLKVAGTE